MAEQNMRPVHPTVQDWNKELNELASVCIYFQTEHNSYNIAHPLSISYYFGRFWPTPDRIYNNIHEKAYRGGGLPFTVNTPQYIIFDYYSL